MAGTSQTPTREARCPTCGTAVDAAARPRPKHYPFCCERCQLVDLGKWLDEEYRVAEPADQSGGGVESAQPGKPDGD